MAESTLGKKIKELLYLKRMSQIELAKKTGIHKQVLSNWIVGYRKPKLDNLQKLAKALDTTVENLLNDKEENIVLSSSATSDERIKKLEEKVKKLENRIRILEKEK